MIILFVLNGQLWINGLSVCVWFLSIFSKC